MTAVTKAPVAKLLKPKLELESMEFPRTLDCPVCGDRPNLAVKLLVPDWSLAFGGTSDE